MKARSNTWRRIAGEVRSNLVARPLTSIGLIGALSAMMFFVFIGEFNSVVEIRSYDNDLALGGYYTLLIESNVGDQRSTAHLTDARCAEFRHVVGVRAVVWFGPQEELQLWSRPGPHVPNRGVAGDVNRFFADLSLRQSRDTAEADLLFDESSASGRIGHGEYLVRVVDTTQRDVVVRAVTLPLSPLGGGLSGTSLLRRSTIGNVAGCALDVAIDRRQLVERSVRLSIPITSGIAIHWAFPGPEQVVSAVDRFHDRPSQYYWALTSAVILAFAVLYARLRTAELALYALFGLRARELWVMVLCELILLATCAATVTATFLFGVIVLRDAPLNDVSIGVRAVGRTWLATVGALMPLGWIFARRLVRNVPGVLKDR